MSGRVQISEMVTWFKRNRSCGVLPVEKTDRLYRNFRDAVTLEDLDIEIHFVKEGSAVSKDSRSQTRLIHGIHLVMARNYSENLREEVKKGMREKALQGVYPGHPPFGYRNNKAERSIEIDPVNSPTVNRLFELYATGEHTLSTLAKTIRIETGKKHQPGQRPSHPEKSVLCRFLPVVGRDVPRYAPAIRQPAYLRRGTSGPCGSQPAQVFETGDCLSRFDDVRL